MLLAFLLLYLIAAADVLKAAFEGIKRGQALDENFLMTIATLTAFIIGDYIEAIAVMVFMALESYLKRLLPTVLRKISRTCLT